LRDDDDPRPTPPSVVGAAAAGTFPVPFIAIDAVLFIVHGSVHPVVPPDITGSTHGELVAGIIAAVVFLFAVLALIWLVNGHRRWPFVTLQAVLVGGAIYLLVDGTKGGTLASVVVALAALAALICVFLPSSWEHFGRPFPGRRLRTGVAAGHRPGPSTPAGSIPVGDTTPSGSHIAGHARSD
jgi:hypothetical protein